MGYRSYEQLDQEAKYQGLKPLVAETRLTDSRITPQEHFDALLGGSLASGEISSKDCKPDTPEAKLVDLASRAMGKGREHPVALNRSGEAIKNTISTRSKFMVEELKYPGSDVEQHVVSPVGQFVYVFTFQNDKELVLEALCGEDGWTNRETKESAAVVWFYRDQNRKDFLKPLIPSDPNTYTASSRRFLPNPYQSGDDEVAFFLSPVQLDKNAIEIVRKNLSQAAVKPGRVQGLGGYVAIPEPVEWASEANEKWLIPKADKHQKHLPILSEDLFIAQATDEFRKTGRMGEWFQKECVSPVTEVQRYIRLNGENLVEASDYVRNMIDSPQHRAVEAACVKDALASAWMLQHWSDVLPPMVCTAKGREFVSELAHGRNAGEGRLPKSIVSMKSSRAESTIPEHLWRGNALTIAKIFLSVYLKPRSAVSTPKVSGRELEKSKAHLRRATDVQLPTKIKQFAGTLSKGIGYALDAKKLSGATAKVKKAHEDYADSSDRVWYSRDEIKLISAYTDNGATITNNLKNFLKGKPELVSKRLTGFLVLATALGDAQEMGEAGGKAYKDAPVTSVLAAGIGTAGVIGSAMTGAAFLGAAATTATGVSAATVLVFALNPYFLAATAVMVLIGKLLFRESKDSPYEQFLLHCRFGKKHGTFIEPSSRWSQEFLGTLRREDELKTVIGMLCAFWVKLPFSGKQLKITPGYLPEGAYFEVAIDYRHERTQYKRESVVYLRKERGRSGPFVVAIKNGGTSTYHDEDAHITYFQQFQSKDGRIESIIIVPSEGCHIHQAYIRLVVKQYRIQIPPEKSDWIRVRGHEEFNSFGVSTYKSSS
jgi:hypothetical protein